MPTNEQRETFRCYWCGEDVALEAGIPFGYTPGDAPLCDGCTTLLPDARRVRDMKQDSVPTDTDNEQRVAVALAKKLDKVLGKHLYGVVAPKTRLAIAFEVSDDLAPAVVRAIEAATKVLYAEDLAQAFHEIYERKAPAFQYKTRKASAVPWAAVPDINKNLMVAVCREILELRLAPAVVMNAAIAALEGE